MVGSGVRSGVEYVSTTGSGGADSSIGSWAGTGTDLDDLLSLQSSLKAKLPIVQIL